MKQDRDGNYIMPKQTSSIFPISEMDRVICIKEPNSIYASYIRLELAKIRFCKEFYKANKRLIDWINKHL